jgi:nitrous oxidase accessory protein NosD
MSTRSHGITKRAVRALAVGVISTAAVVAVAPALASATTVWVNRSAPAVAPPGMSCAAPGYNTIQSAISAAATASGSTIAVCASTYREQIAIEKAVSIKSSGGTATIALPAASAESTTPCDKAGEEDVISICVAGAVKLSGLTVEGRWPSGTCKENLFGIFAGGNAKVSISNTKVIHAGAEPINGCQGGVGIQIGRAATSQVATGTLTSDVVTGYQKNGIDIAFTGSKGTLKKVTVTGAGQEIEPGVLTNIAQNGVEIAFGAAGKVTESTISNNECENHRVVNGVEVCGPESLSQTQSTGVLLLEEAKGSSVTKSTIAHNDIGVYHLAAEETTKPQAAITGNSLLEDRDEGVTLDQGFATVNENTITGPGNVGIQLLQYHFEENGETFQPFGPRGTGNKDTISNMSKWAIQGLSDLNPADEFGSFTVTNSAISGNPGLTPAESVTTNNPSKLQIVLGTGNS